MWLEGMKVNRTKLTCWLCYCKNKLLCTIYNMRKREASAAWEAKKSSNVLLEITLAYVWPLLTLTNVSKCTEGRITHTAVPLPGLFLKTELWREVFSLSCCYHFLFLSWCGTVSIWLNNQTEDFILFIIH